MQKYFSNLKKNSPLKNKRILITRPKDQARDFANLVKSRGAEPILFPTIRIVSPQDWKAVDKAVSKMERYNSVIFTSVNGAKRFLQRLKNKRGDCNSLRSLKICAIGPQTAAMIKQFRLRVDIIPKEFRAESLVDSLEKEGIWGKHFLLPRAEKARNVISEEIKKRGGNIDVVAVYRTSKGEGDVKKIKKLFQNREIDVATFTSSSTVKNFVEMLSGNNIADLMKGCIVACIGPITVQTATTMGIRTDIQPDNYTIQGLVDSIIAYFRTA